MHKYLFLGTKNIYKSSTVTSVMSEINKWDKIKLESFRIVESENVVNVCIICKNNAECIYYTVLADQSHIFKIHIKTVLVMVDMIMIHRKTFKKCTYFKFSIKNLIYLRNNFVYFLFVLGCTKTINECIG